MDTEQFKVMAQESINDVEYLAKLKRELGDEAFYSLAVKTLSHYIKNGDIISKVIHIGSHNWELSLILELEEEKWFSETLMYLTNSFRSAIVENKKKAVPIIEEMYPEIQESLASWHDSFFLQDNINSSNPRHTIRAYFRMLGDMVESTHKPHTILIYRLLASNKNNPLYGRPESVSFGKAVSELLEINQLIKPYKTMLFNVSLSQWRNIAQHSNYRFDKNENLIICSLGLKNSQTVKISIKQLIDLLLFLNKLQALQKIAVSFIMIEFIDDIQYDKYGEIDISLETIVSQLGNGIGLEGFKVISVTTSSVSCALDIEDSNHRGLPAFKTMVNSMAHFMAMLKDKGFDPVFRLYNTQGKKLTEAKVISRKNG